MPSTPESLGLRLRTLIGQHPAEPSPALDPLDPTDQPPVEPVGRREFGRTHLAGLAVVLVVVVVAAATMALRARTQTVPISLSAESAAATALPSPSTGPSGVTPSASGSSGAGRPSEAAGGTIQVHVAGEVKRPGVVELPAGARVHDAVAAAGGATATADLTSVNLAAQLSDGSQVLITARGQGGSTVKADPASSPPVDPEGSGGSAQQTVNLNTATQAQLEELPGVGPVTAQNILSWREQHGSFSRIEELQEVDGIGPKTYARLAPHVTV